MRACVCVCVCVSLIQCELAVHIEQVILSCMTSPCVINNQQFLCDCPGACLYMRLIFIRIYIWRIFAGEKMYYSILMRIDSDTSVTAKRKGQTGKKLNRIWSHTPS